MRFPEPHELPPEQYTWLRQARTEYAAAALCSELLHWLHLLGVSPDTLQRCTRLVSDEVSHSLLSHELYQLAGGEPRAVPTPPQLLTHADDPDASTVWRCVTAAAELAIEESVALPVFAARLDNAGPEDVRERIAQIHRDEAFHRAFAWDLVDELTEALGVDAMRAWITPRLPFWFRIYLRPRSLDHEPTYTDQQLAYGLIDRRQHWQLMQACARDVVFARFVQRGLVEDGVTADVVAAEVARRAQDAAAHPTPATG